MKYIKLLKISLLIIAIAVGYGCQSNYWENRKNDSLDLFSSSLNIFNDNEGMEKK